MISNYRNNFFGYFKFYYSVAGNKLFFSIFLSIIVSILDGLGLAMLMPLLQSLDHGGTQSTQGSMGYLHYITDLITGMGFPLTLGTVLGTMAILFAVKGFLRYSELNFQSRVMLFFMKKVRHGLLGNLKDLSYKGFTTLDAGTIQNGFIAEVLKMAVGIRSYLIYCSGLFILITYLGFALLANHEFAILFVVSAGLTNLIYSRFYKLLKKVSIEVSAKGNNFNSFMIQAVQYFKYLKSTNYMRIYSRKLGEVIDKTEALNRKTHFYDAVAAGLKEPTILLIVIGVIYVQLSWMGGNLGSIILSLMLFFRALSCLYQMQQNWQTFVQNTGAIHAVSNLANTMNTLTENQGDLEFKGFENDITVTDATLAYDSNTVLNKINITIPKSQTIAFVGESGSGKTSLANIIMGLVNPDSGSVNIDGVPLSLYNLNTYRDRIGYISQDPVVFNDTLFNNITFWAEPSPENYKLFWNVIEMVSLKEFVSRQPDKEHTILGDNGLRISGGQKQRISIAREMFKKVDILILDEATSALDSETESLIQENLENLHGHYTMVVIAHRLSTIKNVDKIYLLDKGQVVISGNFDTMVQRSDKFKRMVALQGL